MCGIAGFIGSSQQKADEYLRLLEHRGPDSSGCFTDGTVTLLHTRLSIIDTTDASNQPMQSPCGRYILVFNGEVYNFREIRDRLENLGVAFKSKGDTEVVLHSLIHFGISEALQLFNGMFAICLYDKSDGRLILARDRLGVKPLYFVEGAVGFCFASELKVLAKSHKSSLEICNDALALYLQFMYVPTPYTIFRNFRKLRPGHYLEYNVRQASAPKETKYWFPRDRTEGAKTYQDFLDVSRSLLNSSVGYRLIADVPVGVMLSGGIDSSLVSSIAVQSQPNIETFTIGFNETHFNEADRAQAIASALGTKHHERYLTSHAALQILPDFSSTFDEPFADSSAIPTLMLARFAREKVKVALSADGGDELFGGYSSYEQYRRAAMLLKIPLAIRNAFTSSFGLVTERIFGSRSAKLRSILRSKSLNDLFTRASTSIQVDELKKILVNPPEHIVYPNKVQPTGDFRNDFMRYDLNGLLEGDLLVKVDRASMACGLEAREPLLDYRLVELSMQIPSEIKFMYGPKSILKTIAYDHVPKSILDGPKRGFNVPIKAWLKQELRPMLDFYTSRESLSWHGLFQVDEIESMKRKFFLGRLHHYDIWSILCFQVWFEKWYLQRDSLQMSISK